MTDDLVKRLADPLNACCFRAECTESLSTIMRERDDAVAENEEVRAANWRWSAKCKNMFAAKLAAETRAARLEEVEQTLAGLDEAVAWIREHVDVLFGGEPIRPDSVVLALADALMRNKSRAEKTQALPAESVGERDLATRPYTAEENRVCDYLQKITKGQVGCGADPIGFLIVSHQYLVDPSVAESVGLSPGEQEKGDE